MNQKNKNGGHRPGSGQKPKYGEPTATVSFRVPISVIPDVKVLVKNYLEKFKIKKT